MLCSYPLLTLCFFRTAHTFITYTTFDNGQQKSKPSSWKKCEIYSTLAFFCVTQWWPRPTVSVAVQKNVHLIAHSSVFVKLPVNSEIWSIPSLFCGSSWVCRSLYSSFYRWSSNISPEGALRSVAWKEENNEDPLLEISITDMNAQMLRKKLTNGFGIYFIDVSRLLPIYNVNVNFLFIYSLHSKRAAILGENTGLTQPRKAWCSTVPCIVTSSQSYAIKFCFIVIFFWNFSQKSRVPSLLSTTNFSYERIHVCSNFTSNSTPSPSP